MNLIVYGTLRQGFGNHKYYLAGKQYKEDILTGFKMYSLGAFPFVAPTGNSEDKVTVEIYDIDEETMRRTDVLEGYPSFYNRKLVHTASGQEGWVYFQKTKGTEPIASGDWKQYRMSYIS